MKILVLHGVNLNTLGAREPHIYGTTTLAEIDSRIREKAAALGAEVVTYQTNHEGELVEFIHQQAPSADGILINAGAWTHYSLALRDALAAVSVPFVEVHLSNPLAREPYRRHSVLAAIAKGVVMGLGWRSYTTALDALVGLLQEEGTGRGG